VCVKVPDWARARDIRVDIRRSRLSVAVARRADGDAAGHLRRQGREANGAASALGPAADTKQHGIDGDGKNAAPLTVVLAGGLSRPVQVDECLWTTERAGRVLLYLQKELPADGEPGFEWWASVLDGDPEVDVLTCDAGSDASKYPEHAKRRGAKALWEHQNKTPEERLKEVGLSVSAIAIWGWEMMVGCLCFESEYLFRIPAGEAAPAAAASV